MKKLMLTAVLAVVIGTLSLFTGTNCQKCFTTTAQSSFLAVSVHNILATAD